MIYLGLQDLGLVEDNWHCNGCHPKLLSCGAFWILFLSSEDGSFLFIFFFFSWDTALLLEKNKCSAKEVWQYFPSWSLVTPNCIGNLSTSQLQTKMMGTCKRLYLLMIAEAWKSRHWIIPENLDCKHRWQLTDDFEKQPGKVPTW